MTVPHHALEITLTRPLSASALRRAARELPLAANHNATRLMTLVAAKTPHQAARRLRHRLGTRLPIDVLTTHYPDTDGQILLNVAFPPARHAAIRHCARQAGQSPELFLKQALDDALARHASNEADRLDRALGELLAHTTSAHLLAAVGRTLSHHPGGPRP
ncbi:hypothetical protein ABZ027_30160 [Streptomyces sp. NPDC006332]|uniref:hypothetical protein n=1 Tax=Streptomyces sp. NPDC006332 TaxID=3155456 RepID=UPI0033B082A7